VGFAPISGHTVVSRKTAIDSGLAALTALVLPGQVRAQAKTPPGGSLVVLVKGLYQPVTHGPNLGLSMVDLDDGSYSTTRIYPVQGTPGSKNPDKPAGGFYAQFDGDLCAYHVPGGSFSMRFTDGNTVFVDDGQGGRFLEGTSRPDDPGGDRDLSALRRRPQPHGRQAALPRPRRRLRRRRRVLLLLHRPPMNNT